MKIKACVMGVFISLTRGSTRGHNNNHDDKTIHENRCNCIYETMESNSEEKNTTKNCSAYANLTEKRYRGN